MRMPASAALAVCLLVCPPLIQGCGFYGVYKDKRLVGTIQEDNAIASGAKADLMRFNLSVGWNVAVRCYYGTVFLVGEAPENLRAEAVRIAGREPLVRDVRTHWFEPARGGKEPDIAVAARVRKELIGTPGLGSTRVDVEISAGRVVLLGVADNEEEIRLAQEVASRTPGVTQVTNLMMLPPMAPGR